MSLAEPSGSYRLPVTQQGVVRLSRRLRERHLTEDVDTALVQAAGMSLHVWLFSDRDDVRVGLPFVRFTAGPPFERSLHRWGVNVNRWFDRLERGYAENKTHVEATVTVVEGVDVVPPAGGGPVVRA